MRLALVGLLCGVVPLLAGAVNPVPEPATMLIVGGGLAAVVLIARRNRKEK